jgi:phage shock protein PspC (stress-responsive transcriptional regulator)
MTTLMKSKEDEVTTIILCKLKLKKCILYLILSICMPLYQEGCYIDYQ